MLQVRAAFSDYSLESDVMQLCHVGYSKDQSYTVRNHVNGKPDASPEIFRVLFSYCGIW